MCVNGRLPISRLKEIDFKMTHILHHGRFAINSLIGILRIPFKVKNTDEFCGCFASLIIYPRNCKLFWNHVNLMHTLYRVIACKVLTYVEYSSFRILTCEILLHVYLRGTYFVFAKWIRWPQKNKYCNSL